MLHDNGEEHHENWEEDAEGTVPIQHRIYLRHIQRIYHIHQHINYANYECNPEVSPNYGDTIDVKFEHEDDHGDAVVEGAGYDDVGDADAFGAMGAIRTSQHNPWQYNTPKAQNNNKFIKKSDIEKYDAPFV